MEPPPRRWPTFWKWISIYLQLLLTHAPSIRSARETADVTDEAFLSARRKTGVRWLKPLRRYYEMRPMPEFLSQFLDAVEKYCGPSPSKPPPPPSTPAPPMLRSRSPEPLTPLA